MQGESYGNPHERHRSLLGQRMVLCDERRRRCKQRQPGSEDDRSPDHDAILRLRVRSGSDRGQTGVRPGSDRGQTLVMTRLKL